MGKKTLGILLALLLLGASCGDASSDSASPASSDDSPEIAEDDCGQGQAFPDDPELREAICRPFMAMVDLIGTDAVIDPDWTMRITNAILTSSDDRAASMAELQAVLAEITAAGS